MFPARSADMVPITSAVGLVPIGDLLMGRWMIGEVGHLLRGGI